MRKLIDMFRSVDFSEYETKAYYSLLCMKKNETAPFIARHADIPTSKIYHVLDKLHEKGLILKEPGRPMKFTAIEPKIALSRFMEKKNRDLEKTINDIIKKLSKMENKMMNDGIWLVRGRENVENTIEDMLSKAEKSVVFRLQQDGRVSPFNISSMLKKLKKRKINVQMEKNNFSSNIINVDDREMLIFSKSKEALWINNPLYCRNNLD